MFTGLRAVLHEQRVLRRLFDRAEVLAHDDGRDRSAPEDFVLAALELPDGEARRCLDGAGVPPDRLRVALAEQHAEALAAGEGASGPEVRRPRLGRRRGPVRVTGAAEDLFRGVAEELKGRRGRVSSGQVLAVALEAERGPLVRALDRLGVDRAALRAAARRECAGR